MRSLTLISAALLAATPAAAEVAASSDTGFVSHHERRIAAPPAAVWAELVRPAGWWNGDHSYSGDAANLTLDPAAGGCFCEAVPATDGRPAGQVEHMRVLHVAPHALLRLSGGLGPLQGEAVTGVLTVTIEPVGGGSNLSWDYVVGGYLRMPMREMAPLVDQVLAEQFARLTARF